MRTRIGFALAGMIAAGCSYEAAVTEPDATATVLPDAVPVKDTSPLVIDALGVQGFVLRHGGDAVMTAPLFTRQSGIEVGLNFPLVADSAAIDAGLGGLSLGDVRAVVSGHAHYDHFIDVPHILDKLAGIPAYTNLSGRHILAALAPDRPGCDGTAAGPTLTRDRVIAVDDPLASYVDYTNCPDLRPAGAPAQGSWISVPNSHVRMMPICSMHPAQVGPYHFGEGSIDSDQCDLPSAASGWLEGHTLAFVIDFLDADDKPAFRVFYQDAPTNAPIGHVPAGILGDKRVDVALLCVGSSDNVDDHPGEILANLTPRFGLSGHWEDFFQPATAAPTPIPFLDLQGYLSRAEAALPGAADAPIVIDGELKTTRHVLVQPHSHLEVPIAP